MIASADQIRIAQLPVAVSFLPHGGEKRPAVLRGEAETETLGNGRRNLSSGYIVGAASALRGDELLIKPPCGIPVGGKQTRTLLCIPVEGILRHLHSGALGQKGNRIRIGEIFNLHDEVDDAAAFAAAEAVVELTGGIYRERRSTLIVKRTETEVICPAALPKSDITAYHIDNVAAFCQLLNKVFRKWHNVLTNSTRKQEMTDDDKTSGRRTDYFTLQAKGMKSSPYFSMAYPSVMPLM